MNSIRVRGSTLSTYDSAHRPGAPLEELLVIGRYRDLIGQLIARDIKSRYKRSTLGVAWTMLNPLLTMSVLTIVFGQIFHIETHNYAAYLLSGVLAWNFFAQSTTAAMHQLVAGGSLLRRVYLPRTAFTISAIGTGLVNLAIALVPLAAIMLVTGTPFTPALLWLLIALPLLAGFALGIGLLVSTLAVTFPDVIEMYAVLLNIWFFLTPVMYPITIVPMSYQPLVAANPMLYLVTVFRTPIHDGIAPDPTSLGVSAVVALTSIFVGWVLFTARADRIAYRI